MVDNKKDLRKLQIIISIYIIVTILLIIGKLFLIERTFNLAGAIRTTEDIFSDIMIDTTGFLLIYFSLYLSIIIRQMNENIKNCLKMDLNCLDFDDLYEKISTIQKTIKLANNLLNPCLIIVFIINIFFLVAFGFFVQYFIRMESDFNMNHVWPLLIVFALRIFFWCLSVDKMNQNVNPFYF